MFGRLALVVALVGCGSDAGEPLGGTLAITVGDAVIEPSVGAALPDESGQTDLRVVIGTRDISCETTDDSPLESGTYLAFSIDRVAGTQMPFVSVIRVEAGGAHINGAAGEVTVEGVEGRITGSITFQTTDEQEAVTISVTGTFDVIDC